MPVMDPSLNVQSALQLNGEGDHVIFDRPLLPAAGPFSVVVIFWSPRDLSGVRELVSQAGGYGSRFYLGMGPGGVLRAGDDWGQVGWGPGGLLFPCDDAWHTLVLTRSAYESVLYLDGAQVGARSPSVGNPSGGEFRIGRQYGDHQEYFRGCIAEVVVWDRVLVPDEVMRLRANQLRGNEPWLRALIRFDTPGMVFERVSGALGRMTGCSMLTGDPPIGQGQVSQEAAYESEPAIRKVRNAAAAAVRPIYPGQTIELWSLLTGAPMWVDPGWVDNLERRVLAEAAPPNPQLGQWVLQRCSGDVGPIRYGDFINLLCPAAPVHALLRVRSIDRGVQALMSNALNLPMVNDGQDAFGQFRLVDPHDRGRTGPIEDGALVLIESCFDKDNGFRHPVRFLRPTVTRDRVWVECQDLGIVEKHCFRVRVVPRATDRVIRSGTNVRLRAIGADNQTLCVRLANNAFEQNWIVASAEEGMAERWRLDILGSQPGQPLLPGMAMTLRSLDSRVCRFMNAQHPAESIVASWLAPDRWMAFLLRRAQGSSQDPLVDGDVVTIEALYDDQADSVRFLGMRHLDGVAWLYRMRQSPGASEQLFRIERIADDPAPPDFTAALVEAQRLAAQQANPDDLAFAQDVAKGRAGALALQLNGRDAYACFDRGLIPAQRSFTIAVTFCLAPSSGGTQELLSQDAGSNGAAFYVGCAWQGYIRAGDDWENTGVPFPQDGRWHTLVLVRRPQSAELYLDGQSVARLDRALRGPAGNEFRIGRQYGGYAEYFAGRIAEIVVWDEPLDAEQARAHLPGVLQGHEKFLAALVRSDRPGEIAERIHGTEARAINLQWWQATAQDARWAPLSLRQPVACTSVLQLDGRRSYAAFERALIPTSGPFSVAITFASAHPSEGYAELLSQTGGTGTAFYVGRAAKGHIRIGDGWESSGAAFPQDAGWHTLVVVRGNDQSWLYLDGQEVARLPRAIGNPGEGEFRVGRQFGDCSEYFAGRIAEVAIYAEALDAARAQSYAAGLLVGCEPGLHALLRFDVPGQLVERVAGTPGRGDGLAWSDLGGGLIPWYAPALPPLGCVALQLNGRDAYACFDRGLIPAQRSFTIAVTFWSAPNSGGGQELLSQDAGSNGAAFYVGCAWQGYIRAGDDWENTGVPFPQDGRWHTLVLVRRPQSAELYLDGQSVARLDRALRGPAGNEFRIGRQYGGYAEYFAGRIAEIVSWGEALDAAQVQAHRPGVLLGREPGLRALFRPDQPGQLTERVSGSLATPYNLAWWRARGDEATWALPPTARGDSLQFNGSDGYVAFEQAMVPAHGPFTLAVTFCAPGTQSGFRELVSQAAGAGTALYLGRSADGGIRAGDGWSPIAGARFPSDDAWHTLVLVRSEGDTVLYLDGSVAGRLGHPIDGPRGSEFRIGCQYGTWGEHFAGKIAEVAVFADAHSPERVAAYTPGQLRGDEPTLRALVRAETSGVVRDRVSGALGRVVGGCTLAPELPSVPDFRHARLPMGLCVRPTRSHGLWRSPQQRLVIEQRLRLRALPSEPLTLLQRGYAPTPDFVLALDPTGGLCLTLRSSDGKIAALQTAPGVLRAGRFTAIAVRLDLAIALAQIWVDGQIAAEQRLSQPATATAPALRWRGLQRTDDGSLWLARGPYQASLDVELHEACAWERIPEVRLSAPTLGPLTGSEPGLLGWWRWRDLRDGVVPDASGHGAAATAG